MKRREVFSYLGGTLLALALLPEEALAFVVFDPTNCAQNILSALRTLQSNINEARMLANEVTSLANEAKNLTSLKFDIIDDFSDQFTDLFSAVGAIDGLMENVANVQAKFEGLYPDFLNRFDPVSRTSMAEDVKKWIGTTREMMLGSAKTGAQILQSLPKTQGALEKLLGDSQGAVGILQATQAGNQIAATISGNLLNLNTQMATYTQAHTAFLMEMNGSAASAKNRMDHVLDDWGKELPKSQVPENPF